MGNPFEILDSRLSNIEDLLLSITHSGSFNRSNQDQQPDRCYLEDALAITGLGKGTLYKLTATNEIPCKKFGSRLVFSRKELHAWVERQTKPKHDHSADLLHLAEIANRKQSRVN